MKLKTACAYIDGASRNPFRNEPQLIRRSLRSRFLGIRQFSPKILRLLRSARLPRSRRSLSTLAVLPISDVSFCSLEIRACARAVMLEWNGSV
jgi:hypothetical protein